MSRFPYPDLRTGTTLALVSDRHYSQASFTPERLARVADDFATLKHCAHGIVDGGDSAHGATTVGYAAEDALAEAWTTKVKTDTELPYVWIPGNHDLSTFDAPHVQRTSGEWAAAVGEASLSAERYLTVTDIGDVRILGISADTWDYSATGEPYRNCILSTPTLNWLDEQLTAAGSRPCMIANHAPLWEQYVADGDPADHLAGTPWWTQPKDTLAQIVEGHSNLVAWVSGHTHCDIDLRAETCVRTMQVGARRIFGINGPAAGGRMEYLTWAQQQAESPNLSTWFTWLGDAVEARWYDHQARQWRAADGERVRTVYLADDTGDGGAL